MDIRLSKGSAGKDSVDAISSKSYVHRLLIAAALCDDDIEVVTNLVSNDMRATMRVLDALKSAREPSGAPVILDCGESGSTARFILPLAALLADSAILTGSGKLPQRPMGPLCDALRSAGVEVSSDYLPVKVNHHPRPGRFTLPGNVSSQFVSGLLFMLPLLDGDSHLEITGKLESAAYVDMTLDVLGRFGIRIEKCADGFDIPGGQKYTYGNGGTGKKRIVAEGDWSNSAYMGIIGSLGSGRFFDRFTIRGLNAESIQGDRAAVRIFRDFGIDVSMSAPGGDGISEMVISGRPQNPVDVECSQIPDLVPALAVLASFTEGDSIFRNVGRLRVKECDRIEAVTELLGRIGIEVDITQIDDIENMTVHGHSSDSIANVSSETAGPGSEYYVNSFNDHRIAMAAAAIAFAVDTPVVIADAMAVDKSYPGFFDRVSELGMNVKVLQ